MNPIVYACDIGSIKSGTFAWARNDSLAKTPTTSVDIDDLITSIRMLERYRLHKHRAFLNFTELPLERTIQRMRYSPAISALFVVIACILALTIQTFADTVDNFQLPQSVTATKKAPEATVTTADPRSSIWSRRTLGGILQSSCTAKSAATIVVKSSSAAGLVASFNQATGVAVASYQIKESALQPFSDGKLSLQVQSSKREPIDISIDFSSRQSRFSASTTLEPKKGFNSVSFSIRSGFPGLTSNELAKIEQLSVSIGVKSCLNTISVRNLTLTNATKGVVPLFRKIVTPPRAKRRQPSSEASPAPEPTHTPAAECTGPETAGRSCTPDQAALNSFNESFETDCSHSSFACNPDGECFPRIISSLTLEELRDDKDLALYRLLGIDNAISTGCFSPLMESHFGNADICRLLSLTGQQIRDEVNQFRLPAGSACVVEDAAGNPLGNGICNEASLCVEVPPRVERCGAGIPACTPCTWNGVERRFCFRGECRTAEQAARLYCPEQLRRYSPDAQCQRCSAFFRANPSPSSPCVSGYITGGSQRLLYSMDGATCVGQGGARGTCSNERCVFPPSPPTPTPTRNPAPSPTAVRR